MEPNKRQFGSTSYTAGLPKELGGEGGKQYRTTAGDDPILSKLGMSGYRGGGNVYGQYGASHLSKNLNKIRGK